MHGFARGLSLLFVCISGAACSGDDATSARNTDDLVDRLADLDREQDMLECTCPGWDGSCPPAPEDPIVIECFKLVAAHHRAEVEPELECVVQATAAENACLRNADCTDIDAWEACLNVDDCDDSSTESYEEEVEECARGRGGASAGESGMSGEAGARGDGGAGAGGGTSAGTAGQSAGAGGSRGSAGSSGSAGMAGSAGAAGSMSALDAVPSPGCGSAPSEDIVFTIDVDGTSRQYVVTLPPAYDRDRPYKLILTFHGLGSRAVQLAANGYYDLLDLATESSILVAAQGLPSDPADPVSFGWPNSDGSDVALVRAMLDELLDRYCIDEARIFAFGLSEGGTMSHTLGCEMGDVFRAIAEMSSSGPNPSDGPCVGQVAAWMSHGQGDVAVAFALGEASRDHWVETNHCGATSSPVSPDPCVAFDGCDEGHPVHFCGFDGGHLSPPWDEGAIWSFFSMF